MQSPPTQYQQQQAQQSQQDAVYNEALQTYRNAECANWSEEWATKLASKWAAIDQFARQLNWADHVREFYPQQGTVQQMNRREDMLDFSRMVSDFYDRIDQGDGEALYDEIEQHPDIDASKYKQYTPRDAAINAAADVYLAVNLEHWKELDEFKGRADEAGIKMLDRNRDWAQNPDDRVTFRPRKGHPEEDEDYITTNRDTLVDPEDIDPEDNR